MGPIREERLLTTHITVSLLKAWKVTIRLTVVGIEVFSPALGLIVFRENSVATNLR